MSDLELLDVFANGSHDADNLVAGDKWESCDEFALVDVQVRTADTAGFDLDEHVVVSDFGEVDFDDLVVLWFRVPSRESGQPLDGLYTCSRFVNTVVPLAGSTHRRAFIFLGRLEESPLPDECSDNLFAPSVADILTQLAIYKCGFPE